jgi:hypothetical protein
VFNGLSIIDSFLHKNAQMLSLPLYFFGECRSSSVVITTICLLAASNTDLYLPDSYIGKGYVIDKCHPQ